VLFPGNGVEEIWRHMMSTKKKDTKGEAKGSQGKGKNGQPRPKGYGKKFKGDFGDSTPIRARAGHPKIAALKTYGGLREFLKKEFAQGKSFEAVGKELQVSGSRISEFVNILGIERKKKGKGDLGIVIDRPTISPDGEFKMEAPRKGKIQ
jgi:hypothetical protein